MDYTEPREDYGSTLEGRLDYHHQAGNEPGDPAKAAQAIITIVNEANPPLRLLLGKDAVLIARRIDQAKLAETERWEKLSSSPNFDDSGEHRCTHLPFPQPTRKTPTQSAHRPPPHQPSF